MGSRGIEGLQRKARRAGPSQGPHDRIDSDTLVYFGPSIMAAGL